MKKYFEQLSDPRQEWKTDYSMLEIVVMTTCTVISGCEHWEDIVDFSRVKESWFCEKLRLKLENGIASHDTFQRIFQLIDPKEFEEGFQQWVSSIVRKDNSAENFAVIRHTALNILDLFGNPVELIFPSVIRVANFP